MILSNIWEFYQNKIFSLNTANTSAAAFNPYSHSTDSIDIQNGNNIRRDNLRRYLTSFPCKPPILIVGEAPGWRGCRFTGIPFTSEALLVEKTLPFSGLPTSLREKPYREATATIFWHVMKTYHPNFMVWNCIPLHLHPNGKSLSNRRPTKYEIGYYSPLLEEFIYILQPLSVVAVGRSAQFSLLNLGIESIYVRHPSHGGAKEFEAGIQNWFHKMGIA